MPVDIDALQARLRATAEALQPAMPVPSAPTPIAVDVIAMPEPRRWLFKVSRDDQGRVETILAEPVA